jgi:hypothetical protein
MIAILRKLFAYLVVRAPRSRLAAFAATLLALLFARRLMQEAAATRSASSGGARGRVLDGEYRRID